MAEISLVAAVCGFAAPAAPQNLPIKDIGDEAQTLKPDSDLADVDLPLLSPSKKADLVVAPIPVSNPLVGTGLAGAAVLFYNPNGASQPWVSGLIGGYTDSDTWGVGAFQSMSVADDRVRFLGFAGYGDANINFYGIGPEAGEAGFSVEMNDRAVVGLLDAEVQMFKTGFLRHLFIGGRWLYLDLDASLNLPPPPDRPELDPPAIERNSAISMLGPSFTFDSRDNSTNPRKGALVQGSKLYGIKGLGSDFTHDKLQFVGNAYFPLGTTTVLGIRKQLCGVSDDAPYYDLCMFGQGGDLRGYEPGRYRDGATWALQAEIRQHVTGRFGLVAFGGAGGIAEDTKAIWKDSTVLYSGGGGIRFLASRSANVNLRADIAFGSDGAAFYFGIGEAF